MFYFGYYSEDIASALVKLSGMKIDAVEFNHVEDALYKAYQKSLDYKYSGDRRTAYIAMTANYALHYYVNTGRASVPFLKALVNLSDCRMNTLFKKCIKADTGTEADAIREIKNYLKVE